MKEVTYEDWLKNSTPRMIRVWDDTEEDRVKRKVVYVIKGGSRNYPVRATTNNDTDYEAYKRCAETKKPRRMTHKELSHWLREKPTRECKSSSSSDGVVQCYYTYTESTANEELDDTILIREDDADWREPLVEV